MCNSFNGLFRVAGSAKVKEVGTSEVTEFSSLHSYSYKEGAEVEIALTFWGKRGATAAAILQDGDLVFATGELSFREYKGKQYFSLQVNNYKKVSAGAAPKPRKTLEDTPVEINEELDADIPF